MADVKGVRVTPVRKAAMPESTRILASAGAKCSQPATAAPTLAPALKAGANIPPAAPDVNENIGPAIRRKGIYQLLYLLGVNRTVVIRSLPDPRAFTLIKYPSDTMIRAQQVRNNTCWRANLNLSFQR